ncbi:hypothetical protein ASC81_24340 [Pelomonas sp. Root405]|nr:hypothetical protein ASC81_24340 [Pelomonas sp. Root405]
MAQKSPLFAEGVKNGYFIKRTNGLTFQTDQWQPGMAIVDFTNPAAKTWYQSHLRRLIAQGADCFKTDFGERIPSEGVTYFDGSDPVEMHNLYALQYNEAVFELLQEVQGKDAIVFARSTYASGQRFPVHWGGDCWSTFESMAESLRGGLSLTSCGFAFWSHDIGGFEGNPPPAVYKRWIQFGLMSSHSRLHGSSSYRVPWLVDEESCDVLRTFTHGGFEGNPPPAVYKRWIQFGLMSSHSRLHGSSSYRVPWLVDEESCDVLRTFTQLKHQLMPYLYAKAHEATETGVPLMRAMLIEHPQDPACAPLDRQYQLGESLLVAPVFTESGEVDFYLPEGTWTHLLSGEKKPGGRWHKSVHGERGGGLLLARRDVDPPAQRREEAGWALAQGDAWLPQHAALCRTGQRHPLGRRDREAGLRLRQRHGAARVRAGRRPERGLHGRGAGRQRRGTRQGQPQRWAVHGRGHRRRVARLGTGRGRPAQSGAGPRA